MRTLLIVVSNIAMLVAAVPYLLDIVRGKTKPRVVTWLIWTVLLGIAFAACVADRQWPSAMLLLADIVGTGATTILGFRRGDRSFELLDGICLAGAGVGLALWAVFNSPAIAVIATVSIDLAGAIPTIKHSWQKPHEETWITFLLCSVGGGLTAIAAESWALTAIAYPIYLFAINSILTGTILLSPQRKLPGEPAQLREF